MNEQWKDKNGLIKTRLAGVDSGNGALFSIIYTLLTGDYIPLTSLWNAERGVLMRTPYNSFGQESHDNYLGVAVYCMCYNPRWARVILWNLIKKVGFMQNSFEKGDFFKSQLLRFPIVWIIMLAAAFPNKVVRFLCRTALYPMLRFQTVSIGDSSGTQLQWLQRQALAFMGNPKLALEFKQKVKMGEVMSSYYDIDHPTLNAFKFIDNVN
jgi:hypothetical protein